MTTSEHSMRRVDERLLTAKQMKLIDRPIVQSLLYDINLLPEQLLSLKEGPGHRHWTYMRAVLEHFDMAFKERDKALARSKKARHD